MGLIAERGIHAMTILLVLALAAAALKRWQKRKGRRARTLLVLESGKAAIVYFYSPSCGVCRVSQKPILDRLLAKVGASKVQLVTVDVNERTDLAREWGVTTLPTTYVLGPAGEVTHVNNGLATEPTLRRQLSS